MIIELFNRDPPTHPNHSRRWLRFNGHFLRGLLYVVVLHKPYNP